MSTTRYSIGTISVGAGSTSVTGTGTAWQSFGIKPGDLLFAGTGVGIVATVASNTALTLVRGWQGGALSGANYDLVLQDDSVRSLVAANSLLVALGSNGNLTSIGALATAADRVPYYTGAGTAALATLTAFGRSLIDDADAAAARATLGLSGAVTGTLVASGTDATAGRLLTVGWMGLGSPGEAGSLLTGAGAANALRGWRIDRVAAGASALVGGPSGAQAGTIMTIGHSEGNQHQLFFEVVAPGRVFQRFLGGGAWSAWQIVYSQASIAADDPGLVPDGAEILWPVQSAFPVGWFDTGARLLSGTSQRAILAYGQTLETLTHLLFGAGQVGAFWASSPAAMFSDTGGTIAATLGGQVARVNDRTGNGINLTQGNASLRPLRGRRPRTGVRNLTTNTVFAGAASGTPGTAPTGWSSFNTGGTSTITLAGEAVTFNSSAARHFWSTPSITLLPNTTYVFSTLITVATSGVRLVDLIGMNPSFTGQVIAILVDGVETGSTVVLPVGTYRLAFRVALAGTGGAASFRIGIGVAVNSTGVVTFSQPQLEIGLVPTAYQRVGATVFDVTEAGVSELSILGFDLVDDALQSAAFPSGLTGQAFVAGDGGCYVTDLTLASGAGFALGGSSHNWTGGPQNILRPVTGNSGRVINARVRAGSFTEPEIAALEQFYRALGGGSLLIPDGPNLWTGTPNRVDAGVTVTGDNSVSFSTSATALVGWTTAAAKLTVGEWYLASFDLDRTSGDYITPYDGSGASLFVRSTSGTHQRVFRATVRDLYVGSLNAGVGTLSNITVRRLINRSS